jgi:hypothetical protein
MATKSAPAKKRTAVGPTKRKTAKNKNHPSMMEKMTATVKQVGKNIAARRAARQATIAGFASRATGKLADITESVAKSASKRAAQKKSAAQKTKSK